MEEFLKRSKSLPVRDVTIKFHVVMGNEACDLDSAVSALTYAFYLDRRPSKIGRSGLTTSPHFECGTLFIPLLNIPRSDFPLRTDIQHVLKRNGISAELLTFQDELDLSSLQKGGKLSLTLVDFNVFPERDAHLERVVVNVIDHRPQARKDNNKVSVLIEPVGSCSTLIADIFLASKMTLQPELVDLLYSTILTDTICMSKSAGKTTVKDEKVIAQLEALRPVGAPARQEVFDEVQHILHDVSGLLTSDLLRKDLKVIHSEPGTSSVSVAMCSIMQHVSEFLKRPEVIAELDKFRIARNVDAVILMFLHTEAGGEPSRQLAVFSQTLNVQQQLCQALLDSSDPGLSLSPVGPASRENNFTVYTQGNVVASRKAVLPLVVAAARRITR